jgi:hypothetical protein
MARSDRLRLLLSDEDARQVREWLAPVLARKRAAAERGRRRHSLLLTLWLLVLIVALLTRYF